MNPGLLRHKITFLNPTPNRDAYGGNAQLWVPAVTVWASITQLRGVLLAQTQAYTNTATATHQIVMRYNPTIVETMRVQYGPTSFDALTSGFFDCLTSGQFASLSSIVSPPPLIYTINSISDPDTTRRQLTLLVTVVKK